jgi:hypothetical protein
MPAGTRCQDGARAARHWRHGPRWPARCRITGRQVVRGHDAARQPESQDRRAAPEGADFRRRWRCLSFGDRVRVGWQRWGLRPAASAPAAGVQVGFLTVLRPIIPEARRAIILRSMARVGPPTADGDPPNSSTAYARLAGPGPRHHAHVMFVVSEAEAAAIRTAFEQQGELSAAVELRRLFPGITDNGQARECARVIAGWTPLPPRPPRLRRREALKRPPEAPGGHPKGT